MEDSTKILTKLNDDQIKRGSMLNKIKSKLDKVCVLSTDSIVYLLNYNQFLSFVANKSDR